MPVTSRKATNKRCCCYRCCGCAVDGEDDKDDKLLCTSIPLAFLCYSHSPSLFVSLSVSLPLTGFLPLSLYLSVSVPLTSFLSLSLFLSQCLCLSLAFCLSLCLCLCLCMYVCLFLSTPSGFHTRLRATLCLSVRSSYITTSLLHRPLLLS